MPHPRTWFVHLSGGRGVGPVLHGAEFVLFWLEKATSLTLLMNINPFGS